METNENAGAPAEPPKLEVSEMSEEEAEEVFGEDETNDAKLGERIRDKIARGPTVAGLPDFASLPPGFTIPPGKRCAWMKFKAEWTDAPGKGDRWCMMWPLSESEEKQAYKRSQGEATRVVAELTKQTIRLIDGVKVDRTGANTPGNVNNFWAEIGGPLRQIVQNHYLKTHTLSPEDQQVFFASCYVLTVAEGG